MWTGVILKCSFLYLFRDDSFGHTVPPGQFVLYVHWFVLNNIGHIRPHHTILAFVSGIFFILSGTLPLPLPPLSVWHVSFVRLMFVCLSGLSLVVGLVLYISSINDEMFNRTKSNEAYFIYKYGWSFAFAAISFLLTEVKSSFIQTLPFTVILLSLFLHY